MTSLTSLLLVITLLIKSHSYFFNTKEIVPEKISTVQTLTAQTGVSPDEIVRYSQDSFICDGNNVLSNKVINDNYCDCFDGTDEPGTSACNNGMQSTTNYYIFCRLTLLLVN